jgi:hypothetical protein
MSKFRPTNAPTQWSAFEERAWLDLVQLDLLTDPVRFNLKKRKKTDPVHLNKLFFFYYFWRSVPPASIYFATRFFTVVEPIISRGVSNDLNKSHLTKPASNLFVWGISGYK